MGPCVKKDSSLIATKFSMIVLMISCTPKRIFSNPAKDDHAAPAMAPPNKVSGKRTIIGHDCN